MKRNVRILEIDGDGRLYCYKTATKGWKGNKKMVSDFFKKLNDVAAKKKTEFRLQQEDVARKYDESLDCSVFNTTEKVEKYLEEQLSKFEKK